MGVMVEFRFVVEIDAEEIDDDKIKNDVGVVEEIANIIEERVGKVIEISFVQHLYVGDGRE